MKSRFISALERRREGVESALDAAFIDSELAGYLARKGDVRRAQELVDELRTRPLLMSNARLLAQLNFVEGLILHCSGLDHDAEKKWRRAVAIARLENSVDVLATVSGWSAFVHYTNGRFGMMLNELKNAFSYLRVDPIHGALTPRAMMVVALVLHTCRETEEALLWYESVRGRILAEGDDVEMAALVHNMAWIRVYNFRNALLRGVPVPKSDSEVLRVSSEVVQSYEELVGLASFPAFTPLLQAQKHILSEEFSLALEILEQYAEGVRQQGLARLAQNFNADRAYCLARLGRHEAAREIVESLSGAIDSSIHADDLGVLYSRLRDCASLLGNDEMSKNFAVEAQRNWHAFDALVGEMLVGIALVTKNGAEYGGSAPQQ